MAKTLTFFDLKYHQTYAISIPFWGMEWKV